MLIGDFYYEIPKTFPELNATSFYFVAFCLIVFALSSLCKSKLRPYVILLASLFFLWTFGTTNIIIVLLFALIGYITPYLFDKFEKKKVLILSICLIVFGIFYFKYGDSLIVPLGLSFYSLKVISYIVDVYNYDYFPEKNIIYYLDYVLFFPCITAGPINKVEPFVNELKSEHEFDYRDIATGGFRLAVGLFEKVVFCDFVASVVNRCLDNVELVGLNVLLGVILYSFEIYLDFDSYSNIALGVSRMLGFNLGENFKTPYLSKTITEFWSRWHISLSTWLKDYIYIPLGGNRKGEKRKYLNILIVFAVSAIWHGSTSNFLIWGLGHGTIRIIEDYVINKYKDIVKNKYALFGITILGIVLNFVIVTILWMAFKYQNLSEVTNIISRINQGGSFNYETIGMTLNELHWLQIIIVTTLVIDILRYFFDVFEFMGKQIFVFRWAIYVLLILVFLVFGMYGGSFDVNDFIYRWF